jgi:hypothetical protein
LYRLDAQLPETGQGSFRQDGGVGAESEAQAPRQDVLGEGEKVIVEQVLAAGEVDIQDAVRVQAVDDALPGRDRKQEGIGLRAAEAVAVNAVLIAASKGLQVCPERPENRLLRRLGGQSLVSGRYVSGGYGDR